MLAQKEGIPPLSISTSWDSLVLGSGVTIPSIRPGALDNILKNTSQWFTILLKSPLFWRYGLHGAICFSQPRDREESSQYKTLHASYKLRHYIPDLRRKNINHQE